MTCVFGLGDDMRLYVSYRNFTGVKYPVSFLWIPDKATPFRNDSVMRGGMTGVLKERGIHLGCHTGILRM